MAGDIPHVLVIRDPDSNTIIETHGDVHVEEIDLGGSFDGLKYMVAHLGLEEAKETVGEWEKIANSFPEGSDCRSAVEGLISEARGYIESDDEVEL